MDTPKPSRVVRIGSLSLGGEFPIAVQTMWKSAPPRTGSPDVPLVIESLGALAASGCSMVRFSVPDLEAAEALGALASESPLPLVADIHFDWRIALRCLDFPIAKVRINPGNIGEAWKVAEVAAKAKDKGVPIRVGVNSGSLPKDIAALVDAAFEEGQEGLSSVTADAMVCAAERELEALEACGFFDTVVSMKASDVEATILANERFAARRDEPLHLGVTEAGPVIPGVARSAIALHALLAKGIGATVRVSLSAPCELEVEAGKEIVALSTGKRIGIALVSCPRCGRAGFDTHAFVERWGPRFRRIKANLTIAVMGCVVNGPGEARHADLGISGAGNKVVIFRKGRIRRQVDARDADIVFEEELSALLEESSGR
jgi:(E)-4-hydroxy-3-methylbut-2-enyl-diphosphate synthase